MEVFNEKTGKKKSVKYVGTVKGLLGRFKVIEGSVLVVRNNELLTSEEKVSDKDKIKLLSVISGG